MRRFKAPKPPKAPSKKLLDVTKCHIAIQSNLVYSEDDILFCSLIIDREVNSKQIVYCPYRGDGGVRRKAVLLKPYECVGLRVDKIVGKCIKD